MKNKELKEMKTTIDKIFETQSKILGLLHQSSNTTNETNTNTREISSNLANLSKHLLQEQILNKIIRQKAYEILQLKNIIHQLQYERSTDFQG